MENYNRLTAMDGARRGTYHHPFELWTFELRPDSFVYRVDPVVGGRPSGRSGPSIRVFGQDQVPVPPGYYHAGVAPPPRPPAAWQAAVLDGGLREPDPGSSPGAAPRATWARAENLS